MIKCHQEGFTLIELMIVVAIVGVLAATALPAFQDYSIRSKVTEAVIATSPLKLALVEAFNTGSTSGLSQASLLINAKPTTEKSSKYVQDIQIINPDSSWSMAVSLAANAANGLPIGLNGSTLVFSPNVQGQVPNDNLTGPIDWACASNTANRATALGLTNRTLGTLPARYAPSECR